ncbi:MAG: 50S ribosomal protein L11 methyltransferase [Lachnospiraceae bacterium]|nr:50S ribosomal protein L11 methyltransferase [Lachnospiraceae bacterium]
MKWVKYRIKTTTEAEDIVISSLYDIGLDGAQIEDKIPLTTMEKEQMFVDILPETEADDGIAYLNFFVEEGEDGKLLLDDRSKEVKKNVGEDLSYSLYTDDGAEKIVWEKNELLEAIKETLEEIKEWMDIGDGTVEIDTTEDIDWLNNWKNYFHQFVIEDLLITPSWEEIKEEDKDKKVLHIDPGTAFGTGMHETTQLCIKALKKHIHDGDKILDVGTGSGILGIIGLLYGAGHVVGTDLDPCAEPAVAENLEMNGLSLDKFDFILGNLITEEDVQKKVGTGYDIVFANILAEVLVPLMPAAAKAVKEGGVVITSGILKEKSQMVADAMVKEGLTILSIDTQGEWASVTAKR